MPVPETARHDLYDGLVDLLGADRAGTLMAYVPSVDSSDIATKTDVAELVARVDRLMEMSLSSGRRLGGAMTAINTRLDRLFLALLAGLFVVVAATAGVILTVG